MYQNLGLLNRNIMFPVTRCATPTIVPVGGAFSTVNILCSTPGSTIYYTLDGSTPTASSTEYTGTIIMTEDATIKAICIKAGLEDSAVASYDFVFAPTVPPPVGEEWLTELGVYQIDDFGEFISHIPI